MSTTLQEIRDGVGAVRRVWAANPGFKLNDLTLEQFNTEASEFEAAVTELEARDNALIPLRNDRDARAARLNNIAVRLRAAVKGYFGDNSDEYEQVGGTRSMDRKPRSAGTKPAAAGSSTNPSTQ